MILGAKIGAGGGMFTVQNADNDVVFFATSRSGIRHRVRRLDPGRVPIQSPAMRKQKRFRGRPASRVMPVRLIPASGADVVRAISQGPPKM